jgi:hypothetical protein
LVAVTNGYLASGGDGLLTGIVQGDPPEATPMREKFATWLGQPGALPWIKAGTIRSNDRTLFDAKAPRLIYPGHRPVHCGEPGPSKTPPAP